LDGKVKKKLSIDRGVNSANFSPDFKYFILNNSASNSPLKVSLYRSSNAQLVKVLEDNADLRARLTGYNISPKEFTVIKTADGVELNSWMIKPANFDPNKKYPLLMFVYGGPGSQQVLNQYDGANFYWYQILAQKGYIVACVDNRGTGGRGSEFKKCTYLNLGKLEVRDQIEAANILVNFHLLMPLVLVFKDGRMVVLWHQIVYFKVLTFSKLLLLLLL
jgi:dipeptidyl-peptidase-4